MDYKNELAKTAIFENVSPKYIDALLKPEYFKHFSANEVVVRQGEHGEGLFIILSGEVAVKLEKGMQFVTIYNLTVGSFFGEISMLIPQPRTATIKTVKDCVFFYYDKKTFEEHIGKEDIDAYKISYNILKIIALKFANTQKLITEGLFEKRIEKELYNLRDRLSTDHLL